KYPDCTVVVGGFHPTAVPHEFFEHTRAIDFAVRGGGERTIVELYEAIRRGETDFSGIAGLAFRGPDGIASTAERALIRDLAELPAFPYEKFVEILELARKAGDP